MPRLDRVSSEQPPTAKKDPVERTHHGDTVIDEYAWLAKKDDPDVVAHLEAENVFTQQVTGRLKPLADSIFQEIKGRTQETDLSVPTRLGAWWYYSRTEEGKQYGIQCRVPAEERTPRRSSPVRSSTTSRSCSTGTSWPATVAYFGLGVSKVSPDGTMLAYSTDFAGDERFTLRFKNLKTGELLADEIPGIFYGGAWSKDGSTFFYTTVDDAWRPDKVHRHTLGQSRRRRGLPRAGRAVLGRHRAVAQRALPAAERAQQDHQ